MSPNENVVFRHASNALDFIIEGAMRKLENELPGGASSDHSLQALLAQLQRECDDWAASIDAPAIESNEVSVAINAPRTPYNLASAVESLLTELRDLVGPNDAVFVRIDKLMPGVSTITPRTG